MSFLGHGSRTVDNVKIPEHLGSDVTSVQKKKLAILATMGLGPGVEPSAQGNRHGGGGALSDTGPAPPAPPPSLDKKAALLERERRIREQEERENERMQQEFLQRGPAKKRIAGLQSLGAVQPREEVAPPRPAPATYKPPRSASSGSSKMELNIPKSLDDRASASSPASCSSCGTAYLPNAKFCCECGARRPADPPAQKRVESDDDDSSEEVRPAPGQWKRPPPTQQVQPKKKGKKRRKRNKRDPNDEGQGEDEWGDDHSDFEEGHEEYDLRADPQDPIERARKQAREHGKIYQNMVVESVKGMVSNNYKGFTDADLERRFQLPDSGSKNSLMSEEQVLQMINKERGEKNSAATQRRIQREQAEWQEKLKEHKARESGVHSNSRFERTVVGRTTK